MNRGRPATGARIGDFHLFFLTPVVDRRILHTGARLRAGRPSAQATRTRRATGPLTAASLNGPWTELDTRAPYSNFGRSHIDVAAPGGRSGQIGAGGAVWAACSGFSLIVPICQTGTFIIGASGTSMASPHAAGVAALIASAEGTGGSLLSNRIHQTADDLGEPGTDPFYGKGRVNAANAVGAN